MLLYKYVCNKKLVLYRDFKINKVWNILLKIVIYWAPFWYSEVYEYFFVLSPLFLNRFEKGQPNTGQEATSVLLGALSWP